MEKKYIQCTCGNDSHYIYLCSDEDDGYGVLYFTLTTNQPISFWDKLKLMWKIFKNEEQCLSGDIVLYEKEASELRKFLDGFLNDNRRNRNK